MKRYKKLVLSLIFIMALFLLGCVGNTKEAQPLWNNSIENQEQYDSIIADTLTASELLEIIIITDTIAIDTLLKSDSIIRPADKYAIAKEYMEFRNKQIRQIQNLKMLDDQNKIMDSLLTKK